MLKALILAGGRSERMGRDKATLPYHGKPQWKYLRDILQKFCADVYLSCREEQQMIFSDAKNLMIDETKDAGPISGLYAAFCATLSGDPVGARSPAWLVVACDFPFAQERTFFELIAKRDPLKNATAYRNFMDNRPEPFFCIWEEKAQRALIAAFEANRTSPRGVLLDLDIKQIDAADPIELENVNGPLDLELLRNRYKERSEVSCSNSNRNVDSESRISILFQESLGRSPCI